MREFKQYRRKQIAELRPVTDYECRAFHVAFKGLSHPTPMLIINGQSQNIEVSISAEDLKNGSPKLGDMIARNPNNHNDQWLVNEEYFKENFESID